MTIQKIFLALIASTVLGAAGYGIYRLGFQKGAQNIPANMMAGSASVARSMKDGTGRRVLYWHDPMVPGQKFDQPGKSPFMDMQLVPVYAEQDNATGRVSINPEVQQNLGIRTAAVTEGTLARTVETVGSIGYNEGEVALVQARASGYLERLHVRAPLAAIHRGQVLAELYVPDWVAAQEDYLAVQRMGAGAPEGLLDGARQRMRLAGMSDAHSRLVESSGRVHPRLTITAPIGGIVSELSAREGMAVVTGTALFRINGIATVWVNAEVPESLASIVRPGTRVEATTAAWPKKIFQGRVSALLPEVSAATRTLKARVELSNPGGRLVPGMFARINFTVDSREKILLIPSEAVIQTGKRSVVIVAQGAGGFVPVDIQTGAEISGQTEVIKGLRAGQKVVVSGQFLVDSEASLKGVETRMNGAASAMLGNSNMSNKASSTHLGTGQVEKIDKGEITLSHGPIPSLQWGPMTMDFKLPEAALPQAIAAGDTVEFEFLQASDGQFHIMRITPQAEAAGSAIQGAGK
jgi:Cu(I)/Ag(I) efflux system membrane fusion protein